MLARSWGHLEDLIVLARAVGHLNGDLIAGLRLRDLLMVDFHRGDLLGEIGRVAVKADAIPDRQRALGQAHHGDARSLEVVDDGPDQLLWHRFSSRGSPTTISCPLGGRYVIATWAAHRAGSTAPCGERAHQNFWRHRLNRVVTSPGRTAGRTRRAIQPRQARRARNRMRLPARG